MSYIKNIVIQVLGISAIYLPSTSPANCPKGIEEKLKKEYATILEKLKD